MTRRGVSDLARYIHPEFGGFCLTARLRRDIRVVAVSVLLGTMVGGVGAAVVGFPPEHTRDRPGPAARDRSTGHSPWTCA